MVAPRRQPIPQFRILEPCASPSPRAAVEKWVTEVNEAAGCRWQSIHGISGRIFRASRVFMPYAGGLVRYREICHDVVAHDYEGFALS